MISERDVRRVSGEIEREATTHLSEYAAGMRLARSIMEEELLGDAGGEEEPERGCSICGDAIPEDADLPAINETTSMTICRGCAEGMNG